MGCCAAEQQQRRLAPFLLLSCEARGGISNQCSPGNPLNSAPCRAPSQIEFEEFVIIMSKRILEEDGKVCTRPPLAPPPRHADPDARAPVRLKTPP